MDTIRVLVVDDNETNLTIVSSMLRSTGYEIVLAQDGKTALQILDETNIDIVLLDVMMPEMDGYQVCERIKSNEKTKDISVIFLTALRDTGDLVRGFNVGGVDYVTKPFQREELIARLNNHVQLKVARDLLKRYADEYKNSRNEVMSMLLELSKAINKDSMNG
ncbi:MAG: response regulator [Breznakibacter sp.]